MRAEWREVMFGIARTAATRSKDETTKVGAVVADKDWTPIGIGFNGFPRGAPDSRLPTGGPGRHLWVFHAEENAIYHAVAAKGSLDLSGSRLFCTHRPCARCLRTAFHFGIREVRFELDQLGPTQTAEAEMVERTLGMEVMWGDDFAVLF